MISKESLTRVAAQGDLRRVGEAVDYFVALVTDEAAFTEFGPSESDIRDARREIKTLADVVTAPNWIGR